MLLVVGRLAEGAYAGPGVERGEGRRVRAELWVGAGRGRARRGPGAVWHSVVCRGG